MTMVYILTETQRDELLSFLCDNCRNCYEGLSEEEFETRCENCEPVCMLQHADMVPVY